MRGIELESEEGGNQWCCGKTEPCRTARVLSLASRATAIGCRGAPWSVCETAGVRISECFSKFHLVHNLGGIFLIEMPFKFVVLAFLKCQHHGSWLIVGYS